MHASEMARSGIEPLRSRYTAFSSKGRFCHACMNKNPDMSETSVRMHASEMARSGIEPLRSRYTAFSSRGRFCHACMNENLYLPRAANTDHS